MTHHGFLEIMNIMTNCTNFVWYIFQYLIQNQSELRRRRREGQRQAVWRAGDSGFGRTGVVGPPTHSTDRPTDRPGAGEAFLFGVAGGPAL